MRFHFVWLLTAGKNFVFGCGILWIESRVALTDMIKPTSIRDQRRLQFMGVWSLLIVAIVTCATVNFAQNVSLARTDDERGPATRRVFVCSTALLVRAGVVEEKLLKQLEFAA